MYFYLKTCLLFILLPLSLLASPSSKYEVEPNDLAVNATIFRGSTTLLGTLHPDETDHFLWKVSKKDTKRTWDLVLAPLSNANISIEVSKVLFQKAGLSTVSFSKKAKELKEKTTLFHFANENKSQKRTLAKLLVEKGEYLITITSTELNISQPYSFALLKQKNILYKSGETKKKAKRISLQKNTTLYESIGNDAWFSFEIKEEESSKLWQVDASSLVGRKISLELFSSLGKIQTLSLDSYGKASLSELELDTGIYTVHFKTQSKKSNQKNTNKYMLQIHSIGLQSIDKNEQEPNNTFKQANKIKITKTIHATISYKEDNYDYFVFTLPATLKDKTLNIQLQTQNPDITFTLYDSNQKQLQVKNSDSNYTMNALHLVAKKYYYLQVSPTYSLKGTQAYTLDFTIGKESNSSSEKEPNDKHVQAPIIDPTQTIKGTFTGKEYDCFAFDITKNNLFWSIQAEGKLLEYLYLYQGDKEILRSSNLLDEKLVFNNLYLSSGHYVLCVYGKSDRYSIDIEHKNYDELNLSKESFFEHEPNQSSTQANPLVWEETTQGVLDNPDYFYFTLKNNAHLRLSASRPTTEDIYMKLTGPQNTNQRVYPTKGKPSIIEGTYPAGRYTVILSTDTTAYDYYSVKLERLNPFETKEKDTNTTDSKNISIKLHNIQQDVATYVEDAQRMDFALIVTNESNSTQTVEIQKHSSDKTWNLTLDRESITLEKATTKTVHVTLTIPKNVASEEVVLSFKTANSSSSFSITPKADTPALHPHRYWSVPTAFLGTLNVANTNLGAKRILEHNESGLGYVPKVYKYMHYLFDDMVYGGTGFYLYSGRSNKDENITIELLGTKARELVGISLNLKGYANTDKMLRSFSIHLSMDGKTYTKVISGTLNVEDKEQFFSFRKNHHARYARLTLHDNQAQEPLGEITLGQWKVLAKQKSMVLEKALNIANPLLGGHIVKSSYYLTPYWDRNILSIKEENPYIRTYKGDKEELSFVLGFKHQRTAKVNSIEWIESRKNSSYTPLGNTLIEVSTQTPNGPWEEMGMWDRNQSGENNTSTYTFDKPTWVRYLKFTSRVKERSVYTLPETLKVFEEKPSDTYQSIQGEWGMDSHDAFYETLMEKNKKNLLVLVGNESKDNAYALEENRSVKGEVSISKHQDDWYKIAVHKGQNRLTLTLSNDDSVDVTHILYDANNTRITPSHSVKHPLEHTLVFEVLEGVYHLKIHQPPISVVFAWDNSGSVSPYREQIKMAVHQYVSKIEEGIDNVNLLCFTSPTSFILSDFSSNAQETQRIFNNYSWNCNSSEAENALQKATMALDKEEGIKAVILIADADGGRKETLWESLEKVNPKVFSIRVASSYNSKVFANLMHSWSRVNNGTYSVVENSTQMTQAITHAMHVLKRPVHYTLKMQSAYERPLDDGLLKIITSKRSETKSKEVNKNLAIELILDASGSMLKRIKGKRRIDIAKEVLIKAVEETIPAQTLVALRVFGHKKADACRTDLEVKLQALNVKKMTKILKKIKAKNLAKTPIAASLAKVAQDLSSAKGKKVIILVTDGKETCEGNASKEIEKLKALGIDVRLNIVGFAIEDKALKKEFETWAKLGNGAYFEANDKKSLEDAVKKALQVPYTVYDLDNELLARGIVGDKGLKLKGGYYKVIVESSPQRVYEEVRIIGEESTTLDITKQQKRKK